MGIKQVIVILFVFVILLMLAGCAPGSGASSQANPAGFFTGIWHGWIAPVSLIWGLFNPAIRVYEPINTGWWYDFGFYIAVIGGFGSISFLRRKQKSRG